MSESRAAAALMERFEAIGDECGTWVNRPAMAGALRMLLADLLREHAEALSAAREEGRREGFERARGMAAERYDAMARSLCADAERAGNEKLRLERLEVAEQWESEARAIRAMQDGEGQS